MDIYTRLKQDHENHRQMAEQIMETSGDSEERRRLWEAFKPEAVAHADAEEQTLYATLMGNPDSQEQARHSVSEHKEVDDLMQELTDMDMSSSGWIKKFEKLKERLEHHMDEEENEVFNEAKSAIDSAMAAKLSDDFDERKRAELNG